MKSAVIDRVRLGVAVALCSKPGYLAFGAVFDSI